MESTAVGWGISRREFVHGVAILAIPAYLGSGGTRWLLPGSPGLGRGSRTLSLAAFTDALGTGFRVRTASFRFAELSLVEAYGHPPVAGGADVSGESFSLIFAGDGREAVQGGTYRVGHPAFGWFPLSLAPVGMARRGQRYEAVVNRRVPASR